MSEGRDPAIIARIAAAITRTGCHLLDIHSDPDHNRSVFTMVGSRKKIADGAVALAESATALIDLSLHQGVHPRIGAIDVIPFIPLGSTPMSACVELAQHVGKILGDQICLPVFLYGLAAGLAEDSTERSSQRATLPWIRQGGLPTLSRKMLDMAPDFGPRQLHPTGGAVAIGARQFLVAFNVVLNTADIAIARAIAATLREVNGGLPGVKALGLPLASRCLTQVSMNLTRVPRFAGDMTATSIPSAFRAVEVEANRLGTRVLESEIVGLIPRLALAGTSANLLCMQEDPCERILETRIAELAL